MAKQKQFTPLLLSIAVISAISGTVETKGTLKKDIITQRESFEVVKAISAYQAGSDKFEISDRRFKDGKHSLKWHINDNAPLILDGKEVSGLTEAASVYPGGQPEKFEPAFVAKGRYGGIKLWVYREEASPNGQLTFNFATDKGNLDNPKYQAVMTQNFTGWRAFWVQLEEDAKVPNYQGGDTLTSMSITPSDDLVGSDLYLDMLQFVTFVSHKRHSDLQFTNDKSPVRSDSYKILAPWNQLKSIESAGDFSALDKQDFSKIAKRFDFLINGSGQDLSDSKQFDKFQSFHQSRLKSANKIFKKLNIKRKDGAITGLALFSSRDEQPAEQFGNFQSQAANALFELALDYKLNPSNKKLTRVMDFFDYLEDQGFAAGSSVGTTDHIIRLNFYSAAVFLMQQELADTNRLQAKQETLMWHTRFGKLADWNKEVGENTDLIRGGALPKLVSVLSMPDGERKRAHMMALKKYLEWSIEVAPGYSDTIKEDGSIYHHRGAYQNSYGIQTLTTLSVVHYLLSGTQYELNQTASNALKSALRKQLEFSADFQMHLGITGRFPTNNSGIDRFMLPAYAFMAYQDGELVDEEMAKVFTQAYPKADLTPTFKNTTPGLTYYGSYGTVELMHKTYQQSIKQHPEIAQIERIGASGFYNKPFAGFTNKKSEHWSAQARGFSKYMWDFESGHKVENPYGRYNSFGALTLFATEDEKGLLSLNAAGQAANSGINPAFTPGATTKALPTELTRYSVKAHPTYIEGKHRNFTENTFLGGVEAGDNGIFSMEFVDTVPNDGNEPLFEQGFSFNKSYFFFGNEIIALGSNINSKDNQYNTITTLFQNLDTPHLATKATVNNKVLKGEVVNQGGLFGDPQGNYYIVPANQKVVATYGEMDSEIFNKRDKAFSKVKVDASIAYIDHGKAPSNQGYSYQILLTPNSKQLQAATKTPTYQIVQNSPSAHIVKHHSSGSMGYAIFDSNTRLSGPIIKTDTPIIAMATPSQGGINLSLNNPDLHMAKWNHNMSLMPQNIVNAKEQSAKVTVTVKGKYQLEQSNYPIDALSHQGGNTLITIDTFRGRSYQLQLTK